MINTNLSQFFRSFFYLFTGFIIFDCSRMLVRPIISGLSLDFSNVFHYLLHVKYFWEFSITNNSLFWIFALICVGVAILMKDRSKSLFINQHSWSCFYYPLINLFITELANASIRALLTTPIKLFIKV